MKKFALGAFALTGLIAVASPAMAHHHGKHHGKSAHHMQKSDNPDTSADDLNARSLQQAQTPVPAATSPSAPPVAPAVTPTAPTAPTLPSSSTMPPPSAGN